MMTAQRSERDAPVLSGRSHPLGSTVAPEGTNFSLYARDATSVELLLFDGAADAAPSRSVVLDPHLNRTHDYWHVLVPGIGPGQIYAYRVFGPADNLQFDPHKVLLDPYGKAVAVPDGYSRRAAAAPGDNAATAIKSVVTDPLAYDWEKDQPLRRPFVRTVVYEVHVGGFTKNPNSGVPAHRRGTYAGLIDKIPYLVELGVTAVELMPVFQFDVQDAPHGHVNYWGYAPVSFFAPHVAYSSRPDLLGPLDEFRDMVKALHRAGIEVILDVVYNHTAEGDEKGPTLCYKGLANDVYYLLDSDGTGYANYSGCGNTLNANQAIVRRLIVDSLHYWVEHMHVDGFRFDLASILARDQNGDPLTNPPVLMDIDTDPLLAGTKFIAEAWDAVGFYQVGSFVGDWWQEWNGQFRDDLRSFIRGDDGYATRAAMRLFGSPDIYGHESREPEQSVNFIACHDGFTLHDVVSYDRKHNEANGEDNRDGHNDNRSWNCGIEGPTDDPEIIRLRHRQAKNFLAVTLFALGTPLIQMGDEVLRTQQGNNNAFCQDNELSWFDWRLVAENADILRFARKLIALRQGQARVENGLRLTLTEFLENATVEWHGVRLNRPDWGESSHTLSFSVHRQAGRRWYHFILNAYWEPLEFELPAPPSGSRSGWLRLVDTYLDPPDDIADPDRAQRVRTRYYSAGPRSAVMLIAEVA